MKPFLAGLFLVAVALAAPVEAGGRGCYSRSYVRRQVIVKKVLVPYAVPLAVAYPVAPISYVQYQAPAPVQVQVPLPQPQVQQPVYQQPQYVQQQAACVPCPCPCPCPCPPASGYTAPHPVPQPTPPGPYPPHQPTPADPLPTDPIPDPVPDPNAGQVPEAVLAVFQASCVKCHGGPSPKAGLDLTKPIPDYGLIDDIHARTDLTGVEGYSMPPGKPLSDEEFGAIRQWWGETQVQRARQQ